MNDEDAELLAFCDAIEAEMAECDQTGRLVMVVGVLLHAARESVRLRAQIATLQEALRRCDRIAANVEAAALIPATLIRFAVAPSTAIRDTVAAALAAKEEP